MKIERVQNIYYLITSLFFIINLSKIKRVWGSTNKTNTTDKIAPLPINDPKTEIDGIDEKNPNAYPAIINIKPEVNTVCFASLKASCIDSCLFRVSLFSLYTKLLRDAIFTAYLTLSVFNFSSL